MEILLVIVIVLVGFMGWAWISSEKDMEEARKNGLIDIIGGTYLNGYSGEISGTEITIETTRNKGIQISLSDKFNYKCIPYEDIQEYRIIHETRMQEDTTLLGISKDRMKVYDFFIMFYFDKEENDNITLLIKPKTNEDASRMYEYIKKAMDMYKNGELECSKQNIE